MTSPAAAGPGPAPASSSSGPSSPRSGRHSACTAPSSRAAWTAWPSCCRTVAGPLPDRHAPAARRAVAGMRRAGGVPGCHDTRLPDDQGHPLARILMLYHITRSTIVPIQWTSRPHAPRPINRPVPPEAGAHQARQAKMTRNIGKLRCLCRMVSGRATNRSQKEERAWVALRPARSLLTDRPVWYTRYAPSARLTAFRSAASPGKPTMRPASFPPLNMISVGMP